ncbi:amidohydrolase [bacterium]|nr:amidohydrolase [bacterium]
MITRYTADFVLTCDEDMSLVPGGAIDVADGRITRVGSSEGAPPADRVEHLGGLIMPGLVNTHAHTPMTLVRGAGDGLPLLRWLNEVMWPREGRMTPEDAWWGMTLGAAEMLASGVTTTCEMYLFEEAVIEAAAAAGIRLMMSPGIISALDDAGGNRLGEVVAAHTRYHDPGGTVAVGFGPHSAYDLGIERCGEIAAAARDLDALLHIHIRETREEGADLEAANGGRGTVEMLAGAGVFDGRVLAAHSVWLDDTDIEIYAGHGVAVAHCPISNMKLASGVARVADLRAAGVTVGLGTDGPASNDTLDLWQEIKTAPLLARVASHDASALSPADAIAMATIEGAIALGYDDLGALLPGYRADFIRIDLDRPEMTPVTSPEELIAHLGWVGSGKAVTDVWVGGRQVVCDRDVVGIDVGRALHEVSTRGARLARESGT